MKNEVAEDIKKNTKEAIKIPSCVEFLSTGSTLLDLVLGGGVARGKIINIVGDKSSGKTLIALEIIATAQKISGEDKLKKYYDDAEAGLSFDTGLLYNFLFNNQEIDNSGTIEQFQYNLEKQLDRLKSDQTLLYVLDSLDALTSEAELERVKKANKAREEGKEIKGTYAMEKQKKLSEIFRVLIRKIKDKRCTLIIISQVRMNIGVMFGEKFTRSGGKALDFYASQVIWLAETEKKTKKNRTVGVGIKVRCKKNKLSMPFRECFLDLLFDYGIDDITSNMNFLFDLKDIRGKTKKGEKVVWENKKYTPAAFVKYIEENNLEKDLADKVILKWNDIEEAISSKERKRRY